jgi:hypothetical protein
LRFVQVLLTDEQADLVAAALVDAAKSLDPSGEEIGPAGEDAAAVGRLALLFRDASNNPLKYKPSPASDVVRSIVKAAKVPQPQSRSKRRAGRHQRRRALRHAFRRDREFIDGYNKAQALQEKEQAEYDAMVAEVTERTADQPKYTITDSFGNELLSGIPAEFVLDGSGTSLLDIASAKIEIAR